MILKYLLQLIKDEFILKKDNHDSQIITSEEYLKFAEIGAKGCISLEIYGSWKWIHAELLAETIRKWSSIRESCSTSPENQVTLFFTEFI